MLEHKQSALSATQAASQTGPARSAELAGAQEDNKPANIVVTGRQTNYGDWSLPAELAGTDITTLWLAVAVWSLRRGCPVERGEIAQAFRISPRRAADVMTYILRHQREKVACKRHLTKHGKGRRVLRLSVSHVADYAIPAASAPRPAHDAGGKPKKKVDDGHLIRELRAWFLSASRFS
ncbi:CaiF/GrlA family transcriptional regulator [Serratia marcescens]|uniref:CaiF/GrlA family transcriptional regulator n=1 Tax=Serratia marcescens TaxID=615 RepID=UPI001EEFDAA7|nr:CaiF/GrlA family transcriptional regulator [Serratia marcescens]ULH10495.1 CaiF/GrlA family transcriptional regulator [Serratia marcescens]